MSARPLRLSFREPRDYVVAVALVAVGALWVYLALRAVDVAFTTDEAASYTIFHGGQFVQDANNQWLNTASMIVAQAVFGQSDWAFRLPNLLAFGLYAGSALVLVAGLRHTAARIVALVVLLTDPFLLEFFGLARGYGLSVAFSAAALASYFSIGEETPTRTRAVRLALTGLAASLAFYAN
ncbi:MAG: hypothetical protein ACTHKL_00395, partial [Streptosporangiaceae bacterium]